MPVNPNRSYVGHYSKEPSAIPGMYNGMRVEALDKDNELLFVADAQIMSADVIELVRTSELLHGGVATPQRVSIRGFNAYQNCGVHVDGTLTKLAQDQDSAWLVRELDVKGMDAGRTFSRRPIEARAWVRPADGSATSQWLECRVVNASAGGVCFRTAEALELGDRLQIRFHLRRGKELPPLTVAVRRVTDRGAEYEYGAEFVDLDDEVDALITKTVIQLQIMQP